jgi:integrase
MAVRKRQWKTRTGEEKTAWIVDYTDQHGKRHIQTFQRKKDADAQAAKVAVDVSKGTHVAPNDSITVEEAATRWINNVAAKGVEKSTVSQYRQHINLHILPRIGKTKLAKLTPHAVEVFRDSLLGVGTPPLQHEALSRPMARKVMTSLKSMLKNARHSHVADDVTIGKDASAERQRLEVGKDIPTPDEIRRLIQAAKGNRQRTLLLTAVFTGLRASELRGLRWSDVDLKAGELHVRQRADRYAKIGPPKSKAGTRTVPLPPELMQALKRWKLACPKGEAELVFPTTKGKVQDHGTMLDGVRRAMVTAGVVDKSSGAAKYALHALRHFFASWCINPKDRGGRELPPKLVQTLLGHSSIVMTLDTYGHLFREGGDREELASAASFLLNGDTADADTAATVHPLPSARRRPRRSATPDAEV